MLEAQETRQQKRVSMVETQCQKVNKIAFRGRGTAGGLGGVDACCCWGLRRRRLKGTVNGNTLSSVDDQGRIHHMTG